MLSPLKAYYWWLRYRFFPPKREETLFEFVKRSGIPYTEETDVLTIADGKLITDMFAKVSKKKLDKNVE